MEGGKGRPRHTRKGKRSRQSVGVCGGSGYSEAALARWWLRCCWGLHQTVAPHHRCQSNHDCRSVKGTRLTLRAALTNTETQTTTWHTCQCSYKTLLLNPLPFICFYLADYIWGRLQCHAWRWFKSPVWVLWRSDIPLCFISVHAVEVYHSGKRSVFKKAPNWWYYGLGSSDH